MRGGQETGLQITSAYHMVRKIHFRFCFAVGHVTQELVLPRRIYAPRYIVAKVLLSPCFVQADRVMKTYHLGGYVVTPSAWASGKRVKPYSLPLPWYHVAATL